MDGTRVADYIAKEIKKITDHVFMITGGGAMYLNDAIGRSGLRYICMHNEQALSMAAEASARITGKPSFCIVTSGPGGTNAVTGCYGAWVDSIPVVFISGQVRTETMRSPKMRILTEQEAPITQIVAPITKLAAQLRDPNSISYGMYKAIKTATKGRPGPVWIDIPLDIQRETCRDIPPSHTDIIQELHPEHIFEVLRRIQNAKRPVIIAGSGIRPKAIYPFEDIMKKLKIPTIPSFNSRDVYQFQYPSFGTLGNPKCNDIIQQADLLLVLGCRMGPRQVGWDFNKFAPNAFKIQVDADPEEFEKKTFAADFNIQAELWEFLSNMDAYLEPYENMWALPPSKKSPSLSEKYITPQGIVTFMNKITKPGDIVVFANGTYTADVMRDIEVKKDMRLIINSNCGAMGYGLPAAIGAAVASGRQVYCFEGDGSLQMNVQELQTLSHYNLPVKVFVGENGGYLSIRNTQDKYFEGFHVGADESCGVSFPSLESLADANSLCYGRLCKDTYIDNTLDWIVAQKRPVLCSMRMDPNYQPRKEEYK